MPQTLLLADDSLTIQRVIELTFADEDINVVAVSDGDQAIDRLNAAPPDIVLADIGMPGRSGYEVAEYIKKSPALAHIPVLLLTGAFEPVDQAKAAEAGCDGVLAKPFEPQLVIGRVRELLARPQDTSSAVAAADVYLDPDAPDEAKPEPTPVPASVPAPRAAASNPADYFERLDAAFAALSPAPIAAAAPAPIDFPLRTAPEPTPEAVPVEEASASTESLPGEEQELFVSERELPPRPVGASVVREEPVVTPLGQAPAWPALADAFSSLLAAERNRPADAGAWPVQQPSAPPIDPEQLAERVAELVLERLSDRVVRETVSELVSKVAERLVSEEIERIKAGIK